MLWFKHDSDATQDAKIKKLLIRYGAIGYAIYFHCLELIAADVSETNLTFELEHDSEIIADNLHIKGTAEKSGIAIVEEIMMYIIELGLFTCSDNHIFCFKLLKRLDTSMTSKTAFRAMITEAKERHDVVMISHDDIMLDKKRRDKDKNREEKNKSKQDKIFIPPTKDEAFAFWSENSFIIDPYFFIDYYTDADWKDKSDKKIKNWKNKMRTWNQRAEKNGDKPWKPEPAKEKKQAEFDISREYTAPGQTEKAMEEFRKKQAEIAERKKRYVEAQAKEAAK